MTTTDTSRAAARTEPGRRVVRAAIWLPGLAVAVGAAVATAHGLYEVARAARVPAGIAWLYPLITDGLALVAYTATARLTGSAARYAWAVVVLAAGLSGLAQATFLASGTAVDASPVLRFGVGAWPAIAAAVVAHLLYLLAAADTAAVVVTGDADVGTEPAGEARPPASPSSPVHPVLFSRSAVQSGCSVVQPDLRGGVQLDHVAPPPAGGLNTGSNGAAAPVEHRSGPVEHPISPTGESSARDRARTAAERHATRHGALPTVTELADAAEVSRGTAAGVLKALRTQPTPLHLITRDTDQNDQDDDPTIEEHTQP